MRNVIILTLIILFSQFLGYSQAGYKKYVKAKKDTKGLDLKIQDLKAIQKEGRTCWTVKSILTNNSSDTLLYFIIPGCEPANFMASQPEFFINFEKCDTTRHTVMAVPPKMQRIVNLEICNHMPIKSSFEIGVFLDLIKAKDINENIPDDLKKQHERKLYLSSNKIKYKTNN